jgi:hypothetical protein
MDATSLGHTPSPYFLLILLPLFGNVEKKNIVSLTPDWPLCCFLPCSTILGKLLPLLTIHGYLKTFPRNILLLGVQDLLQQVPIQSWS